MNKEERYTMEYLAENFWKATVDNDVKGECLNVEKGEQFSLIDNNGEISEKGIKYCLYRALKDFTDRTERTKEEIESFGPLKKLDALSDNGFVSEFVDYFKDPKKCKRDFDDWHHEMCKKFINVVSEKYQRPICYGKAQKIVNMAFKNIYCLKNTDRYEEYFKYCHMPLDSIMLEWFYRAGQTSEIKIGDKKVSRNYPSWSKLKYNNDSNGKYSYIEIQEWIREYFGLSDETNIKTQWTPFTAEFVLWKKMQFEFAAEGLYSQLVSLENDSKKDLKSKKEFREKSVKEKKEFLDKKLQTIKCDFINVDFS